jgi:hypothetical protein
MAGPQDPAAAGRDRLRAGHADREQVIDTLKAAFVRGAGAELPPVDRGHQHTAEAARSRRPRQQSSGSRPSHPWRYRGSGYTIGYAGD